MVLGFKPQFKEPILNGTKIHTIREDRLKRWSEYRVIDFATGVRTKNYCLFMKAPCTGTQAIEIIYDNIPPIGNTVSVKVDGRFLSTIEVELLAKNDGFKNTRDFFKWFDKNFQGSIIHWTDFKY